MDIKCISSKPDYGCGRIYTVFSLCVDFINLKNYFIVKLLHQPNIVISVKAHQSVVPNALCKWNYCILLHLMNKVGKDCFVFHFFSQLKSLIVNEIF